MAPVGDSNPEFDKQSSHVSAQQVFKMLRPSEPSGPVISCLEGATVGIGMAGGYKWIESRFEELKPFEAGARGVETFSKETIIVPAMERVTLAIMHH